MTKVKLTPPSVTVPSSDPRPMNHQIVSKLRSGLLRLDRSRNKGINSSKETGTQHVNDKYFLTPKASLIEKDTNSNDGHLRSTDQIITPVVKQNQYSSGANLAINEAIEAKCTIDKTGCSRDTYDTSTAKNRNTEQLNIQEDLVPSVTNSGVVEVDAAKRGWEDVSLNKLGSDCGLELQLCSQEPSLDSAQDNDSQCEVKWDCQSPEAVKQVKQFQGQYGAAEIKKIVSNFSDSHIEAQKPVGHSVRLYLHPKDEGILAKKSRLQKAKDKAAKKCHRRVHNRESVKDVIKSLHDKVAKQTAEDNKECHPHSSEAPAELSTECCDECTDASSIRSNQSCNDDDCWSDDDLFRDSSFLIEAIQNPEKFLITSQHLVTESSISSSQRECSGEASKANQKDSLLSLLLPQVNESIASAADLNDSMAISASCVSKPPLFFSLKSSMKESCSSLPPLSIAVGAKNKFQNCQRPVSYTSDSFPRTVTNLSDNSIGYASSTAYFQDRFKPVDITITRLNSEDLLKQVSTTSLNCGTSFKANCTMVNKCVNLSSQSVIVNPSPGAACKTFQGSIQADDLSAGKKGCFDDSKRIKNSKLNSLKKTFNLDKSLAHSKITGPSFKTSRSLIQDVSNYRVKPTTIVNFKCEPPDSIQPRPPQTNSSTFMESYSHPPTENGKLFNNTTNSESFLIQQTERVLKPNVSTTQDYDSDMSIPYDVFQNLLEVDDILDSQAGNMSASTLTVTMTVQAPISGLNNEKTPLLDTSLLQTPTNIFLNEITNNKLKERDSASSHVLRPDSKQSSVPEFTDSLFSSLFPKAGVKSTFSSTNSPKRFTFKKVTSVQNPPHSLGVQKHRQPSLTSSSSPVKFPKNDDVSRAEVPITESAFDDSFLNDEILFKSQVLPMLEKAEGTVVLKSLRQLLA